MVRQLYSTGQSQPDLSLQLARKSFRTLGYASFEEEILNQNQIQKVQSTFNSFEPKLPNDKEVVAIACGKEFGLICDANGKVCIANFLLANIFNSFFFIKNISILSIY